MDYIRLNKTIKVSIYKQIALSITEAIENGRLKYNDKLPTEKEICEVFDISQTAVKMAYQTLIHENKIKRIKGKGTFVTNRAIYKTNFKNIYRYEDDRIDAKDYQIAYVLFDLVEDDYAINRILKLKDKTQCYLIHRVIKKSNQPIVSQKIYLPKIYFKKIVDNPLLENHLFRWIETRYGGTIKSLHSTFSPIKASSAEAQILNILPNEAIYWIRTQIIDQHAKTIGYIVNYFPGEFSEFEVTVHAKH